jgi:GT2 family glycosyltransferase
MDAASGIMPVMNVAVVVLSQGGRPAELKRCLDALRMQREVSLDVVVVGNGWNPRGVGREVRRHALDDNVGIPQGRNVGVEESRGELVFFADDDAWTDDPLLLSKAAALFAEEPKLGAVQCRLADSDGTTLRRWVPRARVGDPLRSGPAFSLAEGVTIVRRRAFDQVGGWPGEFFYGHEGIELAWRLRDAGWDVRYEAHLVMHHPATMPNRHAAFYRLNARNRVWVARRNLPAPLVALYLLNWTAISMWRLRRSPAGARMWLRGFVEGWRGDAGERRPIRWRTVWQLTRLGQPPVV